jgi:DNA-binding NtrC family response regulator
VVTADRPPVDALPGIRPLKDALETSERDLILNALRSTGGSRKETADRLGVNRTTLFNKMKKYNLMDLEFDGGGASDEDADPPSPLPRSCG